RVDGDGPTIVLDGLLEAPAHLRLVAFLEGVPGVVGRVGRKVHDLSGFYLTVPWLAYPRAMRRGFEVAIVLLLLSSGCAARGRTSPVRFTNLTPGAPVAIDATLVRPAGAGPFPVVIQ